MTIFADHLARRRAGAYAPQILQTVWGYRERRATAAELNNFEYAQEMAAQ